MLPLLISIPALWVGILFAPVVAYLIVQSDLLPPAWRKPGAAAGIVAVAVLTVVYWSSSMPVHAYGVMLAVAALVGIGVGVARCPVVGFEKTQIVDLGLYAVLWGVIGARVFHVFERYDLYFTGKNGFFAGLADAAAVWNGGLVFYGGLIGAMAYVVYFAYRHGDGVTTLVKIFDLGAPCTMFGLAFGRIGCFLNGCCYGSPSSLPWSVAYRAGFWSSRENHFVGGAHICSAIYTDGSRSSQWRDLMGGLGVPEALTPITYYVHPAQLYESFSVIVLGIVLSFVFYRKPRLGLVTALFLLGYPVIRYTMEGVFRGDTPPAFPGLSSLTISQYVSVVGFVAGLIWLGVIIYSGRSAKAVPPQVGARS